MPERSQILIVNIKYMKNCAVISSDVVYILYTYLETYTPIVTNELTIQNIVQIQLIQFGINQPIS